MAAVQVHIWWWISMVQGDDQSLLIGKSKTEHLPLRYGLTHLSCTCYSLLDTNNYYLAYASFICQPVLSCIVNSSLVLSCSARYACKLSFAQHQRWNARNMDIQRLVSLLVRNDNELVVVRKVLGFGLCLSMCLVWSCFNVATEVMF